MWSLPFLAAAALLPTTLATPITSSATPLPVVIWHGLGDKSTNPGLEDVADLLRTVHPGTHVHIISLGADDGSDDQRASFFGNVTAQNDAVCAALSADPRLSGAATRVDALGFSQGGLFLRGLAQRCPGVRVRSLVTFGSPHNGIADLARCGTWDLLCKGAVAAVKGNRWSEWVQANVVPAQYFREIDEGTGLAGEAYLNYSGWLADVNNERKLKEGVYAERLAALETFAMYLFDQDTTLLPKETAWFADVNATTGEVTELKDRLLYSQDWLGLKKLDQRGALVFRTVENSRHMQLSDKLLRKAFVDFFGPERNTKSNSVWSALRHWRWQDVSLAGGDW